MLRRLRGLLAHARAGHRIGCETCAAGRCTHGRVVRVRQAAPIVIDWGVSGDWPPDVADPDELTGEEWAPDDVQRRHVEQEHGGNPYDCLACAPFIVWRATDDLPARSPVDAARRRGEM